MKQCPECNELFDDLKTFCDIDGSALGRANVASKSSSAWITGAIGGFVGVILCILLYIGFLAPNQQDLQDQDQRATQPKETSSSRPSQIAAAPAQVTNQMPAAETATPGETESPEEAAPTATESPTAPASVPPAALNNGPIATGDKTALVGGERAIIKMKDGSSVEADAAWEDSQGIWFRRSGLVSFVERSRVEAITEPPQRRPAAAEVKTP